MADTARRRLSTNATRFFDYSVESAIRYNEDGSRTGHVSALWPITAAGKDTVEMEMLSLYAAAYMAMEHFNNRSGEVIHELPNLLVGCDFYLTSDVRNSRASQSEAVRGLDDALFPRDRTNAIQPFAVFGSATSGVSATLSILNDVYQVVQITGTSTSPSLDQYNYFTRTTPANEGEASGFMLYFKSINVDRIGILYVNDAFGKGFKKTLNAAADRNGITVELSTPFDELDQRSIETSMELLKSSDVRYIISIVSVYNWKPVVRAANQYGIMGGSSGRQWYMAEYKDIQRDDFTLDAETEADIAEALHGVGILNVYSPKLEGFDEAFNTLLVGEGNAASSMKRRFIASHLEPEVYNNVTFPKPFPYMFHYTGYDAMMALGIAACRTPGRFKSNEFLSQLINSEFPGASGWVALDRTTGTRLTQDLQYNMDNVLLLPTSSTNSSLRFSAHTSFSIRGPNITHYQPFVFSDNSTTPLSDLPPLAEYDYNLVPPAALAVGWTLGGLVEVLSLTCMIWTMCNRQKHVVRVSQPIFLCQLCIGTCIMASAIVPLSMQEHLSDDGTLESTWNLDAACMATPWLFCIGFVISISAILAKTLRLNIIMKESRGMKRIIVEPKDVLGPLIVLMTLNVALLLSCTIVDPYEWHRVLVNNVDSYGRNLESYGTCKHFQPSSGDMTTYYFMIPLMLGNFGGLCIAAYHCYKARHLPTEMSESHHVLLATISLWEVLLIGGPIVFLPTTSPTTYFLILSSLISLSCFSILVPIFAPKYQHRNEVPRPRHMVNMGKARRLASTVPTSHEEYSHGPVQSEEVTEERVHTEWGKMAIIRK